MNTVAGLGEGYRNLDTDYVLELLTSPRIFTSRFLAAREKENPSLFKLLFPFSLVSPPLPTFLYLGFCSRMQTFG